MTPNIFNVENPFNVKGKNHETKPANISTVKVELQWLSQYKTISFNLTQQGRFTILLNSH